MKYKISALPSPSKGVSFVGVKDQCLPDQSMSLLEILTRFTRGEAVPVGKDVVYHESEDDLEKLAHMDLVDKEDFKNKLEDTKKTYDRQEKAKAKKAREAAQQKILDEEREKMKKDAEASKAK